MHKLDPLSSYLHVSTPLEVKFARDQADVGQIEGIASHFGGEPDTYGDLIAAGAYTRTLAEHKNEGALPFMLWQHDTTVPIGRWTEIKQTGSGLLVRGQLNLETEPGRRAHAHLKAGDIRGLSIGYAIYPGGYELNRDGSRTLTAIDLKEISLVTLPAQRRAAITAVKSFGSRADLESILRESLPARAAKKLLSGGWPALSGEDFEPDEDPSLAALLHSIKSATRDLQKR